METSSASTLVCTEDGVFIWPGTALVERRGHAFVRAPDQQVVHLAASLHGPSVIGGPLIQTLERVARFLEQGKIASAKASIAQLRLPNLSPLGERLLRGGNFDSSKHPHWPAGAPNSTGGQFRPKDGNGSVPAVDQKESEPKFSEPKNPSKLPKDRPTTIRELNRELRFKSATLRGRVAAGAISRGAAIAEILANMGPLLDDAHDLYSRFVSRFDEPMTLDALIARTYAKSPPGWPGYERHHIVERTPNAGKIDNDLLESQENVVAIPYYLHRDITDYYSTKCRSLGNRTPRDFLRGKSFEEQYKFGVHALRKFGVVK